MITPPTTQDGRNLDRRIADEHGEGAPIQIKRPDVAWPVPPEAEPVHGGTPVDTYYDLPVVKPAPWKWYIPVYFHLGGLAGAASTLAAAATLGGNDRLARKLHWIAIGGEAAGAACLIADLGKPARFIYMLRVFRPTSPMNIGTWILSAAGASSGLALLAGRRGGTITSLTSAVAGAALSTYTGVLLGNTAVPLWHTTRGALPLRFASTSASSLASLLELFGSEHRGYSIAAKVADLAAGVAIERAARAEGLDAPLREGRSGKLWRGAKWLGAASLVATVLRRPRLAGILGTAGCLMGRFAIVDAGKASAADPRATFEPQRRTRATK